MRKIIFSTLFCLLFVLNLQAQQGTVNRNGEPEPICVNTMVDEVFGAIKLKDLRYRVDAFIDQFKAEPRYIGVIISYGTDKEVAKREADIRKTLRFRKFPINRVKFVKGGTDPVLRSRFFIIPKDAIPKDEPGPTP